MALLLVFIFSCVENHQSSTGDLPKAGSQELFNRNIDSLEVLLSTSKEDISMANLLNALSFRYAFGQPEKRAIL